MGAGELGITERDVIGRREILDVATATSLLPQVVEKDYVLGWLLAGTCSRRCGGSASLTGTGQWPPVSL